MIYVFKPDKTVETHTHMPWEETEGSYVYEPEDMYLPWVRVTNAYGNMKKVNASDLPDWIKTYLLLLD